MALGKVLITGASGLLGRSVLEAFEKDEHDCKPNWVVLGFAFTRAVDKLVQVDLNNTAEVQKIVHEFKPDVIIHCAAERSPEKVEEDFEASYKLNVSCSKNLAMIAKDINAAFLYISTDYVFDGENPPYKEDDEPNPLNKYGLSKLQGEKEVMAVNPDSCILRIPVIYGGEEHVDEGAISRLTKNVNHDVPVSVSNYEVRFPCDTYSIASVCLQLMKLKLKDPSLNSIFHWCGPEGLTKYEMCKIIAEENNVPYSHLIPEDNPTSQITRPKNTQLSCNRLRNLGVQGNTKFRSMARFFGKFLTTCPDGHQKG